MYVTRPLSLYRRSPERLTEQPPEGSNSGFLVLFDEEAETTTCFGLCKSCYLRNLPFPQNMDLAIQFSEGQHYTASYDVLFIPVLNQPLSSNKYYVIFRKGKHQGKASTNSKEDETYNCCCFPCVKDVKPREFDTSDTYQQVEILKHKRWGFSAKSVAPDGIPPYYLRKKYWDLYMKKPKNYQLNEAAGINTSLRNRLPDFSFSLLGATDSNPKPVVVGKWYCPFMFVHEEDMEDQIKKSMFYEVTLEQRWEKIFARDNTEMAKNKVVLVDVTVQKEEVFISGVVGDGKNVISNGVVWFTMGGSVVGGNNRRVGLSILVVDQMKWEEGRVGWEGGGEEQVRLERAEEFGGIDGYWRKFGCFVLVERFVFKRMDGSILLTYDFKHTHQIKCKWE